MRSLSNTHLSRTEPNRTEPNRALVFTIDEEVNEIFLLWGSHRDRDRHSSLTSPRKQDACRALLHTRPQAVPTCLSLSLSVCLSHRHRHIYIEERSKITVSPSISVPVFTSHQSTPAAAELFNLKSVPQIPRGIVYDIIYISSP